MDLMNNSKLEELIKRFNAEPNSQTQNEFLSELVRSQLFLTVVMSEEMFDEIKKFEAGEVQTFDEEVGFSINYLTGEGGKKAVPLFTDAKLMDETDIESSAIVLQMSHLAGMLKQSNGKYSDILINPFTGLEIGMPVDVFISLFEMNHNEDLTNMILDLLHESSVELEKETVFFSRSDSDHMKQSAVDGVFTPKLPFNVSSRDSEEDLKYLNILMIPESSKILDIGDELSKYFLDIFIAPGSEFEFVEDIDEFTSVWKCVRQPFYD